MLDIELRNLQLSNKVKGLQQRLALKVLKCSYGRTLTMVPALKLFLVRTFNEMD